MSPRRKDRLAHGIAIVFDRMLGLGPHKQSFQNSYLIKRYYSEKQEGTFQLK